MIRTGNGTNMYCIDEYYCSLIMVLCDLELISTIPDAYICITDYSRQRLYDRLMKYDLPPLETLRFLKVIAKLGLLSQDTK